MSEKPISPLRQRMVDDMTARRFKEKVQKDYVRHVRTFAAFDLVRPLRIVNEPRKAPVVLSQEEVARLLEAAPGLKYKAALSVAYGAGLRVSEVANLKVSDIDSERMTLRVEQGKGRPCWQIAHGCARCSPASREHCMSVCLPTASSIPAQPCA